MTVPDGLEVRCAYVDGALVACEDIRARVSGADRLAAYGLEDAADELRRQAREQRRRCEEVEAGHRGGWGLAT